MRCHYEALGLSRDASAGDVKRAHRRLALLHHPDKNPDSPEDATEQFKLIQAAYDVLSDPQERAWYDNHREAILRGGQEGEAEDDSHVLLQYFTGACYSGFTDSPQGFYAVYRAVFAGIAEQEMEGAPSTEELIFPTFGHSGCDYQTVVHSFYAHWQSFCTHRTLSWAERFDTRHADNRWHKRAMEKENRRARERARRQYSQLVRQLAAFVRRRDPRVQAYRQHLQQVNAQKHQRAQQLQREQAQRQASKSTPRNQRVQRQQAQRQASKSTPRNQRVQRQQAQRQARLAMEYQEQSWVKLSDLERELRQMEAQYQQEFGDGSEEGTSGEEDGLGKDGGGEMVQDHDADDHFFCPACDRTFQSVKTMKNHERSRRHRETVALLRQQLEAEERELLEAQCGQELPPSSPRLSKKDRRKKRHEVFTDTPASPTDSDTTDSNSQSEAESGQGQEGSSGEEGGNVGQEQERGGREQDESTQERAEQGEQVDGDGEEGIAEQGVRAEGIVEQGVRAEGIVEQGEGAEGKGEQGEGTEGMGERAEGKGEQAEGERGEGMGEGAETIVEQGDGAEGKGEGAEGKGEGAEGKGEQAEGEGEQAEGEGAEGKGEGAEGKGEQAEGERGEGMGKQGEGAEGMGKQGEGAEGMGKQGEGAEGMGKRAEEGHHTRSTATPDSVSSPKTKGKKAKQQKKPVKCPENKSQAGLHCVSCEQFFPSRNKLFEHLRVTGHARAEPASTPAPPAAGSRTARRTIARSRNR